MTVFTRFHLDHSEGLIHAERIQDVEAIIENNKQLQTMDQTWAGDWHHLGDVPNVIIEKWMNEDGCNVLAMSGDEFGQYIKRKLRDPDNLWLRATNRRF